MESFELKPYLIQEEVLTAPNNDSSEIKYIVTIVQFGRWDFIGLSNALFFNIFAIRLLNR